MQPDSEVVSMHADSEVLTLQLDSDALSKEFDSEPRNELVHSECVLASRKSDTREDMQSESEALSRQPVVISLNKESKTLLKSKEQKTMLLKDYEIPNKSGNKSKHKKSKVKKEIANVEQPGKVTDSRSSRDFISEERKQRHASSAPCKVASSCLMFDTTENNESTIFYSSETISATENIDKSPELNKMETTPIVTVVNKNSVVTCIRDELESHPKHQEMGSAETIVESLKEIDLEQKTCGLSTKKSQSEEQADFKLDSNEKSTIVEEVNLSLREKLALTVTELKSNTDIISITNISTIAPKEIAHIVEEQPFAMASENSITYEQPGILHARMNEPASSLPEKPKINEGEKSKLDDETALSDKHVHVCEDIVSKLKKISNIMDVDTPKAEEERENSHSSVVSITEIKFVTDTNTVGDVGASLDTHDTTENEYNLTSNQLKPDSNGSLEKAVLKEVSIQPSTKSLDTEDSVKIVDVTTAGNLQKDNICQEPINFHIEDIASNQKVLLKTSKNSVDGVPEISSAQTLQSSELHIIDKQQEILHDLNTDNLADLTDRSNQSVKSVQAHSIKPDLKESLTNVGNQQELSTVDLSAELQSNKSPESISKNKKKRKKVSPLKFETATDDRESKTRDKIDLSLKSLNSCAVSEAIYSDFISEGSPVFQTDENIYQPASISLETDITFVTKNEDVSFHIDNQARIIDGQEQMSEVVQVSSADDGDRTSEDTEKLSSLNENNKKDKPDGTEVNINSKIEKLPTVESENISVNDKPAVESERDDTMQITASGNSLEKPLNKCSDTVDTKVTKIWSVDPENPVSSPKEPERSKSSHLDKTEQIIEPETLNSAEIAFQIDKSEEMIKRDVACMDQFLDEVQHSVQLKEDLDVTQKKAESNFTKGKIESSSSPAENLNSEEHQLEINQRLQLDTYSSKDLPSEENVPEPTSFGIPKQLEVILSITNLPVKDISLPCLENFQGQIQYCEETLQVIKKGLAEEAQAGVSHHELQTLTDQVIKVTVALNEKMLEVNDLLVAKCKSASAINNSSVPVQTPEVPSYIESKALDISVKKQEVLLMDVQNYFLLLTLSAQDSKDSTFTSPSASADTAQSQLVIWTEKMKRHASLNKAVEIQESRLQDICSASLHSMSYCFYDESRDLFMQKLAEMLDGVHQSISGGHQEEKSIQKVERYYVQMVETMYFWIEILEMLILRMLHLPVGQHAVECQNLEKEFETVQRHLSNITDCTVKISPDLTPEMKQNIQSCLSGLHERMGSTQLLIKTSFNQVQLWSQECKQINNETKILDNQIEEAQSTLNEIYSYGCYKMADIEPLMSAISSYFIKFIGLYNAKVKLALQWPGCQLDERQQSFSAISKLKSMALTMYTDSSRHWQSTIKYYLSFENLQELLAVVEKLLSTKLQIGNIEEMETRCSDLKHLQQSVIMEFSVLKCSLKPVGKFLDQEAVQEGSTLLSKASKLIQEIENCLKAWHMCQAYMVELTSLLQETSRWLKGRHKDAENKQACHKEDISIYISFYKSFQCDINNHLGQMKHIKWLKSKIDPMITCTTLEDSVASSVDNFNNLQEKVRIKLSSISELFKQWSAFEKDLHDLQKWFSNVEHRQNRILSEFEVVDEDGDKFFKNIYSLAGLEAEVECKEDTYMDIKAALEQAISLHIYDQATGQNVLGGLSEQWDITNNSLQNIRELLLNKIALLPCPEVEKGLNLWAVKLEEEIRNDNFNNVTSIAELMKTKLDFNSYLKELNVIKNICKSHPEEFEPCASHTENENCDNFEQTASNGILSETKLQKMTSQLEDQLEQMDILILRWTAFNTASDDLVHWLENVLKYLNSASVEYLKQNRNLLRETVAEIKEIERKLHLRKTESSAVSLLGKQMLEERGNDYLKKHIVDTENVIDQLRSTVVSTLSLVQTSAEKQLLLWEAFHEDLEPASRFMTEIDYLLSIYKEPVLNLNQLKIIISKLKVLMHLFKSSDVEKKVLQSCVNLQKSTTEGGIKLEIDTVMEMFPNRFNSIQKEIDLLLHDFVCLEKEWKVFCCESENLSHWIINVRAAVSCLQVNRPENLIRLESFLKELEDKKVLFSQLATKGSHLQNSTLLDELSIREIQNCCRSVSAAMASIEAVLTYCQEVLFDANTKVKNNEMMIQDIESFLDNVEEQSYEVVPISKIEIEEALKHTQLSLANVSAYYATLQCIRGSLMLEDIAELAAVSNISVIIVRIHKIMSKITNYYLKLIETYSKHCTFTEKCIYLFKFFFKFKEFQNADIPTDYTSLLSFYMEAQLMEVYIHAQQTLIQQMMEEGLLISYSESKAYSAKLLDCLNKFCIEWNSLETFHQEKMSTIKNTICLWQNYLLQVKFLNLWLEKVKKETMHPEILGVNDIKDELMKIQDITNGYEDLEVIEQKANETSEHLCSVLSLSAIKTVQDDTLRLKRSIQKQKNLITDRKSDLEELNSSQEKITCELQTVKKVLKSIRLYLNHDIPTSYNELNKKLPETKVEKDRVNDVISTLNRLNFNVIGLEDKILCSSFHDEILQQRQLAIALGYELDQQVNIISNNLDQWPIFHKKCYSLLQWSEQIEKKIKITLAEQPENLIERLETVIQGEIDEKRLQFEDTVSLGKSLLNDEQKSENISQSITSLNAAWTRIANIIQRRLEKLRAILEEKNLQETITEELNQFLSASEISLYSSVTFKELSRTELQEHIQNVQDIQNEMEEHSERMGTLKNTVDSLLSEPDAFRNNIERDVLQRSSQALARRWMQLKTLAIERSFHLQKVSSLWENIWNALDCLEEWLSSKEWLSSEFEFNVPGHSKDVYMEGLGKFENLNHAIQDNIHLLNSVQSFYRDIIRRDADVDDGIKNRVLSATDRWQVLYKRVTKTMSELHDILLIWEDYEGVKEHLLLFLTESDFKITELEKCKSCSEDDYKFIENEFEVHEDELQKLTAAASHLMKQSEPSSEVLEAEVKDIQSYWKDLHQRLLQLKEIRSPTAELDEMDTSAIQYETNSTSPALLNNKSNLENTTDTQADENLDDRNRFAEVIYESKVETQTIATVTTEILNMADASSEEKMSIEEEKLMSAHTSTITSDHMQASGSSANFNAFSEENKDKSTDEETWFVTDLLAVLQETEERMEALETVLNELTPSGFEDDPLTPNFARLIASCQSSMAVLQHLSEILSSNQGEHATDEALKSKADGIMDRWEKTETKALNKHWRMVDNRDKWKKFLDDLEGIERWLNQTLNARAFQENTNSSLETFIILIEKHKELLSGIWEQKHTILTLSLTGQKYIASCFNEAKRLELKERVEALNPRWERLCHVASTWLHNLQSAFLQSSEFENTTHELCLWLEEAKSQVQSMSLLDESSDLEMVHAQYTEFSALKQQLDSCVSRVKTLLDILWYLFPDEMESSVADVADNRKALEVRSRLEGVLKSAESLLYICTERIILLSSLLDLNQLPESIQDGCTVVEAADDEEVPNAMSRCCGYMLRVARASFPIQAILLLLLGAAILMPMDEQDEFTCRLSNNFQHSLEIMLQYPDGRPPV